MNKLSWKGRAIRITVRILAVMPLTMAQAFGRFLGRLMWWLQLKPARDCQTNIEHCFPALDSQKQRELAKSSLLHTGMTAAEWGAMWGWPGPRVLALIKEVEGAELLEEAKAAGKGILLLSPHLGNWELAGLYIAQKLNIAILYQPPKIPDVERFITAARTRTGGELVPTDKRGIIRLFQIIRKQGAVGILPDQEPETSGGIFVPFFGIPANTIKLVSKLVEKTQPRVLTICAFRLPQNQGFRIVMKEADAEIYHPDLVTSVSALNRTVESCVMAAPEQYQWVYKRFKRRPDGQRHFYD